MSDEIIAVSLRNLKAMPDERLCDLLKSGVDYIIQSTSDDLLLPTEREVTELYFEVQLYAAEGLERGLSCSLEHIARLESHFDSRVRELRREAPEEANVFNYFRTTFSTDNIIRVYNAFKAKKIVYP
ncbi:MAG: hypothetical protein QW331_04420 [Candidatus Woesearchaeota archaeon]